MKLTDFLKAEEQTTLYYGVYRDSLVYLFKLQGQLRAGILMTYNNAINPDCDILHVDLANDGFPREATPADFDYFRVVMPSHLR